MCVCVLGGGGGCGGGGEERMNYHSSRKTISRSRFSPINIAQHV